MNKIFRYLLVAIAAVCTLSFVSCSDDDDDDAETSSYSIADIAGIWYNDDDGDAQYLTISEDGEINQYDYLDYNDSWTKSIYGKVTIKGDQIVYTSDLINSQLTTRIVSVTDSELTLSVASKSQKASGTYTKKESLPTEALNTTATLDWTAED